MLTEITIPLFIFVAALLYASVGHGGASAYLAVMGLFGLAPGVMKPVALTLNILVASVAMYKFYRAGHFSWRLFLPFALTSIPFAFIGGAITLPGDWYKVLVGLVLFYAAFRLFQMRPPAAEQADHPPAIGLALVLGAGIGLLSGLTGVGGGIFLSPILLLAGWAGTKRTAAVAAAFILVNSIAGLLGNWRSILSLPWQIPIWGVAALAGGWLGARNGSQRLTSPVIRKLLAVVLVIAALKMVWPLVGIFASLVSR
jgi:uncharacterized membrane protein YfcA